MTTKTYSSKSNATKAARKALGDDARFTTDKTAHGWTWAPFDSSALTGGHGGAIDPTADQVADFDAVEAEMDRLDAAEADAARTGSDLAAVFESATAEQPAPIAKAQQAIDAALVVDGVTFPNLARANQARQAKVGRERAARAGFPKAGAVKTVTPAEKAPSKATALVELAKRPEGVTADELREASGWSKLGGFYGAVQRAGLELQSMRDGSTTRFFAFDGGAQDGTRVYVRLEAGGTWTFVGYAADENAAVELAGPMFAPGVDTALDTGKSGQYLVAPRTAVA